MPQGSILDPLPFFQFYNIKLGFCYCSLQGNVTTYSLRYLAILSRIQKISMKNSLRALVSHT